jgi:hypothetical protein
MAQKCRFSQGATQLRARSGYLLERWLNKERNANAGAVRIRKQILRRFERWMCHFGGEMSSICGKNCDAADGGGTGMGSDGTAAVALQTQTDLVVGTARALCAGKVPALYRICVKTGRPIPI